MNPVLKLVLNLPTKGGVTHTYTHIHANIHTHTQTHTHTHAHIQTYTNKKHTWPTDKRLATRES